MNINKVVVIGSGTMGSGIAAHLCNANIPVVLLDLKTEIADKAKEKILKSRPPLLFSKDKIVSLKTGNIDDDFDNVSDADWIIEAVVERIDIKHNIYKKIFEKRKKGSIISSNTSTIPLKILSEKLKHEDKKDFCITHFFNPVRYMGLLEIVRDNLNDQNKIESLKNFCEKKLGKGVIICGDTPGFLGNRIGVYAMQVAMTKAIEMNLSIEEADAVFGRPMGIPKTGVFALYDLIGIDLMQDVLISFKKELSKEDKFQKVASDLPIIGKLVNTGYTGRKGKGGFYRMNKTNEKKVLEALDLNKNEYFPVKKIDLQIDKIDLLKLISRKDKYGEYAWAVISEIILYSSSLVPQITNEYNDIDEALRLGFNWSMGPFEMLDSIGLDIFFKRIDNIKGNKFLNDLKDKKLKNFYDQRQKYTEIDTLGKIKKSVIKLDKNDSAEIYRFKDFNIVEFKTKANALDYDSMDALKNATDKPLIIINESMQFSAGVNLNYVMDFIKNNDLRSVEKFIKHFQETCKHLKYSNNPVISAPSGLALGGGEEVLLQSNYVVTHTNIVMGLVETIVGLVPAGGGCKELLWRWTQTKEGKNNPDYAPIQVFNIIGYAKTASSPQEAKPLLFLDQNHDVIINRNELLPAARSLLENKENIPSPQECKFRLSGENVRKKMHKLLEELYNDKKILDHGMEVGKELAYVLSGGDTNLNKEISEDQMYKLELDSFMKLIETNKTQDRILYTLKTGKPLIN